MEREEIYSITDAKNAVNNFKTKEENRNYFQKYGKNIFGKDKQSKISQRKTIKVRDILDTPSTG